VSRLPVLLLPSDLRMKLATAPVNWNSPDVPEYREYTPYPQLLAEMIAAGYSATEWSSIMPKHPEVLIAELAVQGLRTQTLYPPT
jgi:inosose dehydratase